MFESLRLGSLWGYFTENRDLGLWPLLCSRACMSEHYQDFLFLLLAFPKLIDLTSDEHHFLYLKSLLKINLSIFGCVGSSLLRVGFL